MQQGFPRYPGTKEQLKAENDLLKQQLRERGAQFPDNNFLEGDEAEEVENVFLKNILEYEKQIEKGRKISIFDKLGRPVHFKPPADIPDDQIDAAWKELLNYLHEYSLDLDVCSPAISTRELYRFAIQELFFKEMDDINVPGMITCFIYDEFHPDPVYDNTIGATDYCMKYILEKEPFQWMHRFRNEKLWLNQFSSLTQEQLKDRVNHFKGRYDDLVIEKLISNNCSISDNRCIVAGMYAVKAITPETITRFSGPWRVYFEKNEEFDLWDIVGVEVEGISFE